MRLAIDSSLLRGWARFIAALITALALPACFALLLISLALIGRFSPVLMGLSYLIAPAVSALMAALVLEGIKPSGRLLVITAMFYLPALVVWMTVFLFLAAG